MKNLMLQTRDKSTIFTYIGVSNLYQQIFINISNACLAYETPKRLKVYWN